MGVAGPVAAAPSPCLDEQVVLDLIAGDVRGAALVSAEQHLAVCDGCTELIARLVPVLAPGHPSVPTQIGKAEAADPRVGTMPPVDDADPPPQPVSGPTPSLQPGTILRDTYRIVRHIEKGGMGEVYEASHARLSGRYAVKVLPPEFAAHKTMLSRFRREAQIASGLQHPNIVQVIDFHETDEGRPYLVMEYLDGENLAKLMARHGPFTPAEALPIVQQIAAALGAVHRQGIVHRDIKPQNVFIVQQQDGTRLVKLLDFGISKGNVVSSVVTRQPALMGTPQYMAPEQALRRTEDIGPATDQFALSALVYEMLTGRPAFEGPLISVVLYQIVHEQTAPMGGDGRFDQVEPVLRRALAKTPGERFSSMAEFAAALTAATSGSLAGATVAFDAQTRRPPPEEHRSIPPISGATPLPERRRSLLAIAALVATGAAAAGVLFLAIRWISPPAPTGTGIATPSLTDHGRPGGPEGAGTHAPASTSARWPTLQAATGTTTPTPVAPPVVEPATELAAPVRVSATVAETAEKRPAAAHRAFPGVGPRTPHVVRPSPPGADHETIAFPPAATSLQPAPPPRPSALEATPAPAPPAPAPTPRLVEEL